MRLPIRDAPPAITVAPSYRQLYEHGAFAQRELMADSQFENIARDRDLTRWIGQEDIEALDLRGALCPIAFFAGGYSSGSTVPAEAIAGLAFREEAGPREWSTYAFDAWGYPQVSPLYIPWQSLYLDVVVRQASVSLPINLAASPAEAGEKLEPAQGLFEIQRELLEDIDASWRPLMKILVVAQNVYWPQVTGRVTVIPAGAGQGYIEAGNTDESPQALLERAGCSTDELTAAYYFLVERGLDREPQDGMVMLRRAVPRAYHVRWRGPARQAQDHFDAAQMLYLWLRDLTGAAPEHPDSWPLDGRQVERAALYDNGPASEVQSDALKEQLIATELYPHGPMVIGEGISEFTIIDWLIQALIGVRNAFAFHDLEGSGAASRVADLAQTFDDLAARAFVVVDNEGQMAEYLKTAINDGTLNAEDVLLSDESLEYDNFSPQELIDVVRDLGANPPDGREPAALDLTAEQLLEQHASRRQRATGDKPGIADTLLSLARNPQHGSVNVSKPELAEGLAGLLVQEIDDDAQSIDAIKAKRPIVRFVTDRIIAAIDRPRPIS